MRYNGTMYYYVFNVFGDITHLLDSSGNIVVEYQYDSYGNITSMTNSTLARANPYRYRGYRYDEESGLYYLNARYYDPEIGRFISADSLLKASDTILGHNMFAYTENNPIVYVDETGNGVCLSDASVDNVNGPICQSPSGSHGTARPYFDMYDLFLTADISAKLLVDVGISIIINVGTGEIDIYGHVGVSGGTAAGVSTSFGVVENYDERGSYKGHFTYAEGSYGLGVGHSWDPTVSYDDAVKSYEILIGTPSVDIGYQYYFWLNSQNKEEE